MQSDKLPNMPVPVALRYDDVRGEPDEQTMTPVFTAQQMQAYALVARKAALEEAAQLCDAKVAQLKKHGVHQNQIGTAQILGESIRALGGDA